MRSLAGIALVVLSACGATASGVDSGSRDGSDDTLLGDAAMTLDGETTGPYASRVVSFEPGPGAGFGQSRMPGVVLGPPVGGGDSMGSTDVVSLGQGGRICLAFDTVTIVDGDGVDFLVFENAFTRAGTADVFAELGEVSVSDDGVTYRTFACTQAGPPYPGCAGWNPVYSRPDNGIASTDPRFAGGDGFDLRDVGLTRARFVCIRDLGTQPLAPPTTGFDLDAVAAVHFTAP